MKLDQGRIAAALGGFFAVIHLFWVILVAFGWAQPLMDFIYSIHFLNNPFNVAPFNLTNAVILIVVTAFIGGIFGSIFASVWNNVANKK